MAAKAPILRRRLNCLAEDRRKIANAIMRFHGLAGLFFIKAGETRTTTARGVIVHSPAKASYLVLYA
jgi:hypothetical protein